MVPPEQENDMRIFLHWNPVSWSWEIARKRFLDSRMNEQRQNIIFLPIATAEDNKHQNYILVRYFQITLNGCVYLFASKNPDDLTDPYICQHIKENNAM